MSEIQKGTIPTDYEDVEYWKSFGKMMISNSPTIFSDIVKVFLTAQTAYVGIYLAAVGILTKGQTTLSSFEKTILFTPLFLSIISIIICVFSLCGNSFAFDLKKTREIQSWYDEYVVLMRKRIQMIAFLFIFSIVVVPYILYTFIT